MTYLYDRANRLISTTLGGVTTQFSYNGVGARLRQVVAGVPTTYTQDLAAPLPVVLQAKTGGNATQYLYSIGTHPIGQYTSAWEYLLPDALGSVRQIVDANGNVTLAKSYEPYGSVLNSTGSATSIFAYAGEEADNTGLIYLRARYVQPTLGIFTSRDPWSGDQLRPGSTNGWNYVEESPINRTDPNGSCVFCDSGDAIKVDGRPDGELIVYARPDENAPELARIADNHRVRIADSQPTNWGRDGWRRVEVSIRGDGQPSMQIGWVKNVKLLDNCEGSGVFACLPVGRWAPQAGGDQGFGATQIAWNYCHNDLNCIYSDLRGLHDGLDFSAPEGSPLVWAGRSEGIVRDPNSQGDARPAITINYDGIGKLVVYGHRSDAYVLENQRVRPGQTIGTSGHSGNGYPHLHFGVTDLNNGAVTFVHDNPLYYFTGRLQAQIVAHMSPYAAGYNQDPYSMISFDSGQGGWYWADNPDLACIAFRPIWEHGR